jgi:hypothetical protein
MIEALGERDWATYGRLAHGGIIGDLLHDLVHPLLVICASTVSLDVGSLLHGCDNPK